MARAKVGAGGIEYIQGTLKRPKKVNGHNHGNYVVMTHRTAETENPNCQRVYTFDSDRYKDSLEFASSDQAAFLAQKDSANGKKTMKSYLWSVCGDQYDAEHPQG